MADQLLTPEQAAERLLVAKKTILDWLRTGQLKGRKAGRLVAYSGAGPGGLPGGARADWCRADVPSMPATTRVYGIWETQ